MHGVAFIQDLAVVLLVAGAVTVLFHRIRQPVVLGYLLAGLIVGAHTPLLPLIHNQQSIQTLADLGMVMLMFGLGLHFSLRQLFKVGAAAFLAAVLEISMMIWIGYELGRAFGWSPMDSIFLGALVSISSTTIIARTLEELHLVQEGFARITFAILIIEDILAIALIALLSGVAQSGGNLALGAVATTVGTLALFLISVLVVGLLTVPRLLSYVARLRNDEMFLVAVLGLCFGVSLLAVKAGYSIALGAFLIGAIMAEAKEAPRIRVQVEPVRNMFSAIFFVAIGMLLDPELLAQYWLPVIIITAAVVVGKTIACATGSLLAGTELRTAVKVGTTLALIGEFSFIIAQLGQTLKVTSGFLYPVAVSVSGITTLISPYLIRSSDRISSAVVGHAPAPLRAALDWYARWAEALREMRHPKEASQAFQIRRLIRKWVLQIVIDLALVMSGMVLAWHLAAPRRLTPPAWLPGWTGGVPTLCWGIVMVLALPLMVHMWYKQRALAWLLAELVAPRPGSPMRQVASLAFQVIVIAGIAILLTVFSVSLLPPWPVLALFLAFLILVLFLGWHRFVTFYYRAQVSVMESFADKPGEPLPAPSPALLDETVLIPFTLRAGLPAVGRSIRDLAIRSAYGANIVAIERHGRRLVNPQPDEQLQADDVVMLFGTEDQVRRARGALLS
ncbi:MAG: cation:proton antiporter [Lentisphaeria bacterium]